MDFPVIRIAEPRSVRLVTSARLRGAVLQMLADNPAQLDDLAEIEGATSGRLNAQKRGTQNINPQELVAGVPHANFINAAFAYWLPQNLNRFNSPGRGAWYAALKTETCLAEVIFHMNHELQMVNDFNACVDYAELFASFAGEFVDLRDQNSNAECLHPDPNIGYPAGNLVADTARRAGHNGIIYPSIRDNGGTCFAILQPKAVQSVGRKGVCLGWFGRETSRLLYQKSLGLLGRDSGLGFFLKNLRRNCSRGIT